MYYIFSLTWSLFLSISDIVSNMTLTCKGNPYFAIEWFVLGNSLKYQLTQGKF